MRYRLIVFDWDGTLMDSQADIVACMQGACGDLAVPVLSSESVSGVIGLGLMEAIRALWPEQSADFHRHFADRYRYRFLATADDEARLFPGTEAMLGQLQRQGYLLAVATGKSRAGLDRAMQASDLDRCFHASRCADESGSKPHPAMLHELMGELDVSAAETLMVGDTSFDLEMARNARVDRVGVSYGAHGVERLYPFTPLVILDDIRELAPWLGVNGTHNQEAEG